MTLETHQITGGIGITIILVASGLTLLGLESSFRLLPPLLVCAGAGFLAYSFYRGSEKDTQKSIGNIPDSKAD